jgi:hypothetical protein
VYAKEVLAPICNRSEDHVKQIADKDAEIGRLKEDLGTEKRHWTIGTLHGKWMNRHDRLIFNRIRKLPASDGLIPSKEVIAANCEKCKYSFSRFVQILFEHPETWNRTLQKRAYLLRAELGEMTVGFRFRFRSGHLHRRNQAQLSCLRADREAARRRPGD